MLPGPGLTLDLAGRPLALRLVIVGPPYPLKRHGYQVRPKPGVPPSAPLVKRVYVHEYDPEENRSWKAWAGEQLRMASGWRDLLAPMWPDDPVAAHVLAAFQLPKGSERKRDPVPMRWMTSKPDLDNVEKALLDSAKSILWTDDRQCSLVTKAKVVARQGEGPRMEVTFRSLRCCFDIEGELTRYDLWPRTEGA